MRSDADPVILNPGDRIELTHFAEPPPDRTRRVFMLAAKGKYETLGDSAPSAEAAPSTFALEQNYPNPFNPSTNFEFSIPTASHVSLAVYNILGQTVAVLVDQELPAGRHSYVWNGRGPDGSQVASGVYFARLSAGDNTATKKMVVVK